ncbi:MAG TPA: hypothetical protein VF453_21335 [Burkholderiaceae bacterium]
MARPSPRALRAIAVAGAAAIVLAYRLWPDPYTHAARIALFVSVLANLVAVGARSALDFRRRRRAGERRIDAARQSMPPALRRLLVMEFNIYREGFCTVLRLTPPSVARMRRAPAGRAFTAMKGSFSSVFLPLVVVGCVVDTPLLHLYIHRAAPPASRDGLHALVVAATMLGLVWAIGDRSAVRHMRHVVAPDVVMLNAGFRRNLAIPRDWIAEVGPVAVSLREHVRAAVANHEMLLVSHMDAPNVLISLKASAFGHSIDIARPQARIRRIGVYVDEPWAFAQQLAPSGHAT